MFIMLILSSRTVFEVKTALTTLSHNSVLYELDQVLNHRKTCKGTHKGSRVFSEAIQHYSLLSAHNVVNGECSVNIVWPFPTWCVHVDYIYWNSQNKSQMETVMKTAHNSSSYYFILSNTEPKS